jgi:alpha-L-fucosidase
VELRYTLDGTVPNATSTKVSGPIRLATTSTVTARCFRGGKPVSGPVSETFTRVKPTPGEQLSEIAPGIRYDYFEGDWSLLPDFAKLKAAKSGVLSNFDLTPRTQPEYFGIEYSGYVQILEDGVYSFYLSSDDGSRLFLDNQLLIDNDGLHSMVEKKGVVALAAGFHPLKVQYFQKSGGRDISVSLEGPATAKQSIPSSMLFLKK